MKGCKITDFAYSLTTSAIGDGTIKDTETNLICFLTNDKGEVYYRSRVAGQSQDTDIFCRGADDKHGFSSITEDERKIDLQEFYANVDVFLLRENLLQLAFQSKSTFISKVACGESHALFLTSAGYVYSLGSNRHG